MTKARGNGNYPLAVSAERLADILAGVDADRRARWREGGRRGREKAKANREARRKAAHAKQHSKVSGRRGMARPVGVLAGFKVIASRMAPGAWYSVAELRDLGAEFPARSVKAWLKVKLFDAGIVERAHNPDFDCTKADRRQSEPRFVYRLTARGIELTGEWRKQLSEADSLDSPCSQS